MRQGRCLRSQRVEEDDRGAAPARPATEPYEVGQVSDAPAVARPQRIELNRPAPGAVGRRGAGFIRELETPDTWRPVFRRTQGGEDGVGGRASRLDHATLPAVIGGQDPPAPSTVKHLPPHPPFAPTNGRYGRQR